METLTITRGLSELKLLDARIRKEINNTVFISFYQRRNSKELLDQKTNNDFEQDLKAHYQSINDLIDRRKKIKSAILLSNSKTEIKIGNEKYTVVEAIEKKTAIEYLNLLLNKMNNDNAKVTENIESQRVNLEEKVEEMIKQSLGTDKKTDKQAYDDIAKPFFDANEFVELDPLKIKDKIEKLEKDIDNFLNEVDFVLSESNAKTEIKI